MTVVNNAYNPGSKAVGVGATVTWAWDTSCHGSHSVTSNTGAFGSAVQESGTYSFTFTSPGVYAYHCMVHGAAMSGTVTVS